MTKDVECKKQIIKLLATKSVAKYKAYDNTMHVFNEIKKELQTLVLDLKSELKVLGEDIPVEYKEVGEYEIEFKVAGDLLLFYMHTNIFEFPKSHSVRQQSYVIEESSRAYCGIISVYNFLADSFKYNRVNDVGYLIGRIFVNMDFNFLVEGKRQMGFIFNNYGVQKMDNKSLKKIIETALKYSIELDLIVPPYQSVSIVSVQEMKNITSSVSLKTGKPLGFRSKAVDKNIK